MIDPDDDLDDPRWDAPLSFHDLRYAMAHRPHGPEGLDYIDDLAEILGEDLLRQYPNAPRDAALNYGLTKVRLAIEMGAPDDDDAGGSRTPRKPAPTPAPEMLVVA